MEKFLKSDPELIRVSTMADHKSELENLVLDNFKLAENGFSVVFVLNQYVFACQGQKDQFVKEFTKHFKNPSLVLDACLLQFILHPSLFYEMKN